MRRTRIGAAVVVCAGLWVAACSSGSQEQPAAGCASPVAFTETLQDLQVTSLGEPTWVMASQEATFSSPRVVDLDDDGVLDVVQGFGQDTFGARQSSIVATNGATGAELWKSTGHDDLVGSPTFAHLGGDDTIDVVIGGRRGALLAIDGATGSVLWEFDDQGGRWFNFYTSQAVDDQNGDGVVDVVAANGGLVINEPEEGGGVPDPDERFLGTMFVVSGADGSVISSVRITDQRESYMSPIVLAAGESREAAVLVGTGGETLPGSLWQVPLASLVADEFRDAEVVVSGGEKGIIAAPSLADLTVDCMSDIVVQAFDGTITAVDGVTNDVLWSVLNEGFETYSTPTLGFLVGDDQIPDVFAAVARGAWPDYQASDYLIIDGETGTVVWRETLGTFAPSGFVAVDLNSDGRDEVIFGANDPAANTQQLYVLEPSRGELHELGEAFAQTTFAAPWIGDLDGDGQLDLLVTASAYQANGAARVHRFTLGWAAPGRVSWGGYLGTDGTGALNANVDVDA